MIVVRNDDPEEGAVDFEGDGVLFVLQGVGRGCGDALFASSGIRALFGDVDAAILEDAGDCGRFFGREDGRKSGLLGKFGAHAERCEGGEEVDACICLKAWKGD